MIMDLNTLRKSSKKNEEMEYCGLQYPPTYSPQSNGMCVALNGTLKRYYINENCLDTP